MKLVSEGVLEKVKHSFRLSQKCIADKEREKKARAKEDTKKEAKKETQRKAAAAGGGASGNKQQQQVRTEERRKKEGWRMCIYVCMYVPTMLGAVVISAAVCSFPLWFCVLNTDPNFVYAAKKRYVPERAFYRLFVREGRKEAFVCMQRKLWRYM